MNLFFALFLFCLVGLDMATGNIDWTTGMALVFGVINLVFFMVKTSCDPSR